MKPGVITTHGIIFILSFVSCFSISCDKDNTMVAEKEQTLIGKWKLTELYHADSGVQTSWIIGSGFEFKEDNTFIWVIADSSFKFRGEWRLDHDQSLLICEGRTYTKWPEDTVGSPGTIIYSIVHINSCELWLYYLNGHPSNIYNNETYKYTYCRE